MDLADRTSRLSLAALAALLVLAGPLAARAPAVSTLSREGPVVTLTDDDGAAQQLVIRRAANGRVQFSDPAKIRAASITTKCGTLVPQTTVTCTVDVTRIIVDAGGGDDEITNEIADLGLFGPEIDAGDGADRVTGSSGPESVVTGDGDDTIDLGDGNDGALGGPGADKVQGGGGADNLDGGPGDDTLDGGAGDDTISGRTGVDTLTGDEGNDNLTAGDDIIAGGTPPPPENGERVDGGPGDDTVRGNPGDDTLAGGPGTDLLDGRAGNDVLDGGTGNDGLQGGDGTDTVDYSSRETGVDVTVGDVDPAAPPPDTFKGVSKGRAARELPNTGFVRRNDGSTQDAGANGNRDAVGPDVERVLGGSGPDRLVGDDSDEVLLGGDGDDALEGGGGADTLNGSNGDDTLQARDGIADAALVCGPGNDRLTADPNDPPGTQCEPPNVDASTAGTPPPAARGAAPGVQIRSTSVRLDAKGNAIVRIRCLSAAARCNGRLRLLAARNTQARVGRRTVRVKKGQLLASATVSFWRERDRLLTLRVSQAARSLIARLGKLATTAVLEARDEAFPADRADVGTARRAVLLQKPAAKKKG